MTVLPLRPLPATYRTRTGGGACAALTGDPRAPPPRPCRRRCPLRGRPPRAGAGAGRRRTPATLTPQAAHLRGPRGCSAQGRGRRRGRPGPPSAPPGRQHRRGRARASAEPGDHRRDLRGIRLEDGHRLVLVHREGTTDATQDATRACRASLSSRPWKHLPGGDLRGQRLQGGPLRSPAMCSCAGCIAAIARMSVSTPFSCESRPAKTKPSRPSGGAGRRASRRSG